MAWITIRRATGEWSTSQRASCIMIGDDPIIVPGDEKREDVVALDQAFIGRMLELGQAEVERRLKAP